MTYQEFCSLNGVSSDGVMNTIDSAVFPTEEFSPEFTIILYSTDGISDVIINGNTYTIRRKCISVWRHGQTICFTPSESLKYKVVIISGRLDDKLQSSSLFLTLFITEEYPVIRITSAYNETLKLFFDSLRNVCGINDNPYKTDCQLSILRAFFYSTSYYVYRSLRYNSSELHKFATEFSYKEDNLASRFVRIVEQNASTERHLSYYAAQLDYNPKYLSAYLKRETGRSGQEIIDHYSTLTAMARLSYGHQSIKEISDEMNFQSQSDFGKFFKRMTGESPLAYRKKRLSRN